jgi:hypothetical protein
MLNMLPVDDGSDLVETPAQSQSSESEKRMIAVWMRRLARPGYITEALERRADDREYYTKKVFCDDDKRVVAVNLLSRFAVARGSMIFPPKPWIRAQPVQSSMTGVDPQTAEMLDKYGQTLTRVSEKLLDEARAIGVYREAVAFQVGTGVECVKLVVQTDESRMPCGRRMDDAQDQFRRLAMLSREFSEGEFLETDARYHELVNLSDYARRAAAGGQLLPTGWQGEAILESGTGTALMSGLAPEVEFWKGLALTRPSMDDMFMDWDAVDSVEDLPSSPWIVERIWGTADDFASQYDLTTEEKKKLGTSINDVVSLGANRSQEGIHRESDADRRGDDPLPETQTSRNGGKQVAIFEVWDRVNYRHSVFAPGIDRFLVDEVVEVAPRRFYPYFLVSDTLEDGSIFPASAVHYGIKMQREINQILTDLNQARTTGLPRFIAEKGSINDEDAALLQMAMPWSLTFVNEDAKNVLDRVTALPAGKFEAAAFQITEQIRLLEICMQTPVTALGVTGTANFAREVESADTHMATQANMAQERVSGVWREIAQAVMELAIQVLPFPVVRRMLLGDVVWPEIQRREDLYRFLQIEMVAGGSHQAQVEKDLKSFSAAADTLIKLTEIEAKAQSMGRIINVEPIAARILASLNLRMPLDSFFSKVPPQQAMAQQLQQLQQAGAGMVPQQMQGTPAG